MALTDDEFTPCDNTPRTRTCNNCSARIKGDRSHRRRHLEKCKAYNERVQTMMVVEAMLSLRAESAAGGQPSNLEQQRITNEEKLVASMIVLDGCDPSILDTNCFIKSVWPNSSEVPSRAHIEEVCDIIFDEAKRVTAEILKKQVQNKEEEEEEEEGQRKPPGRVSLVVGKAKTLDREVIYMACHFIDKDWELHKVVLGAYVLVPDLPHHGPLSDVTEVYSGGSNHMIGEPLFDTSLLGVDLRSRLFMMAWGALPSHESNHYRHHQDMDARERHSDAMKNQLARVFHSTFPVEMGLLSTSFIDQVLEPVARCLRFVFLGFKRTIHQELKDLHLTRQVRQELHSELGLEGLSTFDKNWYRTYCALRILQIKKPDLINEDRGLAKLLIDVFGVIYRAIQAISDPSCPTSNLCLPELLKVRKVLRSELERSDGGNSNVYKISPDAIPRPEDITRCLRDAKGTLDKVIEDSYPLWSMPLVLDPRYKFRHIRDTLFPNEYVPEQAAEMSSRVLSKLNELYTTYGGGGSVSMDIGSSGPSEQPMTEIDTYLNDNPVSFKGKKIADQNVPREECCEILNWWKENNGKYPTVAQMARDTLAMPTCSRISSKQMAHVKSIIRGYSKNTFEPVHFGAAAQDDEEESALAAIQTAVEAAVETAKEAAKEAEEAAQDEESSALTAAEAAAKAARAAAAVAEAAMAMPETASTLAAMEEATEAANKAAEKAAAAEVAAAEAEAEPAKRAAMAAAEATKEAALNGEFTVAIFHLDAHVDWRTIFFGGDDQDDEEEGEEEEEPAPGQRGSEHKKKRKMS